MSGDGVSTLSDSRRLIRTARTGPKLMGVDRDARSIEHQQGLVIHSASKMKRIQASGGSTQVCKREVTKLDLSDEELSPASAGTRL